jgi:hypothetical protein
MVIERYLMWLPVASRCAGFDRWDFAIVIPVIWQKESKRRKLERFCQV